MSEWISVKDRMPESFTMVFVNIPVLSPFRMNGELVKSGCDIATWLGGGWHFSSLGDVMPPLDLTVTHWMPLPEPPEEE